MRAIVVIITLLVLLLSMYGAQTQSTQTEVQTESQSTGPAAADEATTQLDVSAELREFRDMVVELRVLLTVTQNELQNTKSLLYNVDAENDALHKEMAVLKTRLSASETEVGNMKKENAAQTERLVATETDMEHVKKDSAAQETELTAVKTRLSASETEVENLKMETAAQEAELTAVKTRLSDTETDVVNLEREITQQPKVAFSVGLGSGYTENTGSTDMNLVFTRIITNVGQAYSSITGFFTAPVRGVYYFRFTVMDAPSLTYMHIKMCKNGEQLMRLHEYSDGHWTYVSGGLTLQLEVGDVVNMRLPAGYKLYEYSYNPNTFSGFLLFPL